MSLTDTSGPRHRWRRRWRAFRKQAAFPTFAITLALLAGLVLARLG